jgi:hypothetical protein
MFTASTNCEPLGGSRWSAAYEAGANATPATWAYRDSNAARRPGGDAARGCTVQIPASC